MKYESKTKFKRLVALALAMALTTSQISTAALAVDPDEENTVAVESVAPVAEESEVEEIMEGEEVTAIQEMSPFSALDSGISTYSSTTDDYGRIIISQDNTTFSAIDVQNLNTSTTKVIAPLPTVKVNGTTLKKDTDYTLTYEDDNYTLGTKTIKITGMLGYTGSATTTFQVGANLNGGTLNHTPEAATEKDHWFTYTGAPIQPEVASLTVGNLTLGKDDGTFTVKYGNEKSTAVAGGYTVTATGVSEKNVVNSISSTYAIVAADLAGAYEAATVAEGYTQVTNASYTYTGSAITPDPVMLWDTGDTSVGDNGIITLVRGTDYSRALSANVNTGEVTITLTGKGNFTGTKEIKFNIVSDASLLTNDSIPALSAIGFTGTQRTASEISTTVTSTAGVKLVKGTDYDAYLLGGDIASSIGSLVTELKTNGGDTTNGDTIAALNAGGYSGENYFVVIGKGSYEGCSAYKTMSILGNLSKATVTLDGVTTPSYTFTGKSIEPESILLKIGETTFSEWNEEQQTGDYTVTANKATINVGTVTLTFKPVEGGVLNSTTSITATYKITAANINDIPLLDTTDTVDEDNKLGNDGFGDTNTYDSNNYLGEFFYTGEAVVLEPVFHYIDDADAVQSFVRGGSADFSRALANNTALTSETNKATMTLVGVGNLTGTRVVTFDIVAPTADQADDLFGDDAIVDLRAIGFTGAQRTGAEMAAIASVWNTEAATPVKVGTAYYTPYLLGGDISSSIDDIVADLVVYAHGDTDYDALDDATKDALEAGGYPGENYYVVIGNEGSAYVGSSAYDTFDITANISKATVELYKETDDTEQTNTYSWTGTTVQPADVKVMLGGIDLLEDGLVEIEYSSNLISRGTVTITVTPDGDYATSSITKTYTIGKADIADAVFLDDAGAVDDAITQDADTGIWTYTAQTYTGEAVLPELLLGWQSYDDDGVIETDVYTDLVRGSSNDYSRAVANNVNVGTATFTLTGAGNYSGTMVVEFDITLEGDLLQESSIAAIASQTYVGTNCSTSTVAPRVGDAFTNVKLTEGTHYTAYILQIPSDGDIADYIGYLTSEDALDNDDQTALDTAIELGGTPGENYYVVIGIGDYDTYGAAKAFDVVANLSKASYALIDEDGNAITSYYYNFGTNVSIDEDLVVFFQVGSEEVEVDASSYEVVYANTEDGTRASVGNYNFTIEPVAVGDGETAYYTGKISNKFPIVAIDLEDATYGEATFTMEVVGSVNVAGIYDYTGNTVSPFAVVKYQLESETYGDGEGQAMMINTDFTLSHENNIDAGAPGADNAPTLVITGKGNFTGTATQEFTILAPDVTLTVADIDPIIFAAAPQEPTPAVTVTIGTQTVTLVEGVDYTYSYSDNLMIGTATCTVTGMGNYANKTATKDFIIAGDLADAIIQIVDENGNALTNTDHNLTDDGVEPAIKVYYNGEAIDEKSADADGNPTGDYTVAYTNNDAIGTATITVTAVEGSDYVGSISTTFQVIGKSLEGFEFAGVEDEYAYTGVAITFHEEDGFKIWDGGDDDSALTLGKDYNVSYKNNTNLFTLADAASALDPTITVTGIGDYAGTLSQTFSIILGDTNFFADAAVIAGLESQAYTGDAVEVLPSLITIPNPTGSGTLYLQKDTHFEVDATAGTNDPADGYSDNVDPGEATVTIKGKSGSVYENSTTSFTFDIIADLSDATVTFSNSDEDDSTEFTYSGEDVAPASVLTFELGDDLPVDAKFFTSSYDQEAFTVTGNAVTVTYAVDTTEEDSKYYTGTTTATFTVVAADISEDAYTPDDDRVTVTDQEDVAYTGKVQKMVPVITDDVTGEALTTDDYDVSYENNNTDDNDDIILPGEITMTVTGKGNYTGTQTITYSIEALDADALIADAVVSNVEGATTSEIADIVMTATDIDFTALDITIMSVLDGDPIDLTAFFDISCDTATEPGVHDLTIEGKGGTDFEDKEITGVTFILLGDLATGTLTLSVGNGLEGIVTLVGDAVEAEAAGFTMSAAINEDGEVVVTATAVENSYYINSVSSTLALTPSVTPAG